jgi:inhibitor of the pro-sigma K processing machinery
VCLWLLSLSAGLTGICLPINPVTCLVSGTLGLPGLVLLLILQFLL